MAKTIKVELIMQVELKDDTKPDMYFDVILKDFTWLKWDDHVGDNISKRARLFNVVVDGKSIKEYLDAGG